MKCPIDKTEMEKGIISSYGSRWAKGDVSRAIGYTWFWLKKISGPVLVAYRCPECGKVELTTEV